MVAVLQIVAIALFLVAGLFRSRDPVNPWPGRDLFVNVATGFALFVLKQVAAAFIGWIGLTWARGVLPLGWLPWPIALVIGFLALDLSRYALHYMHHRVPFFWQFHAVHHSTPRLDATAGLRMHVVDFVQLALLPVVLFGLVFDLAGLPGWFFPVVLIPGVVFDAFEHSDVRIDPKDPFWQAWDRVLNNPHFHAWHHTDDGHLRDGNYGNVLTIWDRLFGTCVSEEALPAAYGLDRPSRLVQDPVGLQLLVKEL